nr:PREDICTED: uncharacterized protein LOC106701990 isoform X2 [Latimeria chalumnae]|eukprot:XP_014339566.1 PREDICTED: uncharacterized protein LOC106701990 isoform X2 [Latimeria chalumnae]
MSGDSGRLPAGQVMLGESSQAQFTQAETRLSLSLPLEQASGQQSIEDKAMEIEHPDPQAANVSADRTKPVKPEAPEAKEGPDQTQGAKQQKKWASGQKSTIEDKAMEIEHPDPQAANVSADRTKPVEPEAPEAKEGPDQTQGAKQQKSKSIYSNILKSNTDHDSYYWRRNVVRLCYIGEKTPEREYIGKQILIDTMNFTALQVYALIHIHGSDIYDVSFHSSLYLELFWDKYNQLKDTKPWENFIAIRTSQANIRWATILLKK